MGHYAVALWAENEDHLKYLSDQLTNNQIPHQLIVEPDMDNQATAIGVFPIQDRKTIRPIVGKLKLIG